MTKRRFATTTFFVQSFTVDQWAAIERAGKISLSQKQRETIQAAYEKFQEGRESHRNGVSPSDLKTTLSRLSKHLHDCRSALEQLMGRDPISRCTLHELRMASALRRSSPPERGEIADLGARLQRLADAASYAEEALPKSGRGPISKSWIDNFIEAAEGVFREASGPKKFRKAYLNCVSDAAGYKPSASEQSFMRKGDKARRRQRGK